MSNGSVSFSATATQVAQRAPSARTSGRPSDADIRQIAQRILETGRRVGADDYNARARHFVQEIARLSPQDGARLIAELIRQDRGAIAYWMDLGRINGQLQNGGISAAEYAAVANAFVSALNDGQIDVRQARQFLGIDQLTDMAPAFRAEAWNALRNFLAAADDRAADIARESLASSLLDDVVAGRPGGLHAAGIAMQLAADTGKVDLAARLFAAATERAGSGINDPAQAAAARAAARGTLLAAIGESSIGFENSRGGPIPGLVNPLATLIQSVATRPSTQQWRELSIEIARYASRAEHTVFRQLAGDPVVDLSAALTQLLVGANGQAVLTALTAWETGGIPGRDGHAQRYGQNAIELASLLRLTAFNPQNPRAAEAMAAVTAFAESRKAFLAGQRDIPGLDVSTARQQLGMLGAAAFDAVQQMRIEQQNRAAATEALIGFVVDLALAGFGGGKLSTLRATTLVVNDLKSTFGNNPRLDAVIDQFVKSGDTLTAHGVKQLKAALAAAIGSDAASLELLRADVSRFVADAIVAGLPNGNAGTEAHRDIVQSHIQVVQTEIRDVRGR